MRFSIFVPATAYPAHWHRLTSPNLFMNGISNGQPLSENPSFIWLSTSSLITLDGSPGIVGQFRDITMRKRAEAALAQANVALSHMARVDGLTQIPNRRAFDETLAQEWGRLAREESPLSLILCDIDCF